MEFTDRRRGLCGLRAAAVAAGPASRRPAGEACLEAAGHEGAMLRGVIEEDLVLERDVAGATRRLYVARVDEHEGNRDPTCGAATQEPNRAVVRFLQPARDRQ